MNGLSDFAFALHHQSAVDATKAVLLYGKDSQIKRLAQEIQYMRRLQK